MRPTLILSAVFVAAAAAVTPYAVANAQEAPPPAEEPAGDPNEVLETTVDSTTDCGMVSGMPILPEPAEPAVEPAEEPAVKPAEEPAVEPAEEPAPEAVDPAAEPVDPDAVMCIAAGMPGPVPAPEVAADGSAEQPVYKPVAAPVARPVKARATFTG